MSSTYYKISVKDSYEKKNTVKIDEFIRSQSEIRIIICTGGGYGNQRASITIINRILESGFNGKFYFNCDKRGDVRKKFDILLAQSYLDLKNIEYEEFDIIDIVKFTPVNLSFCGADDGLFNNLLIIKKNVYDFFNIKFLIALVPTDFIHYGQSIIYCKDIKIPFDTSDFVLSNHQKKYTLDYVKTKIFDDYYKNIYVILNDTYYTQAIYGLNDWNTNFMKKLDLTYNTKEKWNYSQTRGIDINEELKRII
ncbi:MAG: hypothetical protein FJ167_15140, partial [Gammaproteobacteria bacterium]|nr:hypothetical protein [Gammaproteobacteria bacterium]